MDYQYRKKHKKYLAFLKNTQPGQCDFCSDPETLGRSVHKTQHAYVLPNRTPYDVWELHDVTDHLMLIPLRHVHSLSELNQDELQDIMQLLAKYEGEGYNIYARAKGSHRRSVYHQHTHLIKINTKEPKISIFIRKPWLLIKF